MADIKVIKYDGQFKNEHNPAADSIQMVSFKTATKELTDAKLARLLDGADANDEHIHDTRYYRENEFIVTSAGVADAGKPIILDATGKLDASLVDLSALNSNIDHGLLLGLGDDDHTQYIRVDGTRAFTGNQDIGGFLLTGLGTPVNANDATRKAYVDAVAVGLRPIGQVRVATTTELPDVGYNNGVAGFGATLTADNNGALVIDGVSVVAGDRVLVKNQVGAPIENGIYIVTNAGSVSAQFVLTRAADQDNTPLKEVVNGVMVPRVMEGTVNADKPFVIVSIGTGPAGPSGKTIHILGTDPVTWDVFTSPTQLQAGDGIEFSGNIVNVDFNANAGLKFVGGKLSVEPNDFAGAGLIDDGSDNLAIDWATVFTIGSADAKAIRANDLASTTSGRGASIVGVEDANAYFTSNNQEGVNNELYLLAKAGGGVEYTAGAGGVTKGNLVYISANNTVLPYSNLTLDENIVGMALETVGAGLPVSVARFDKNVTGILSGASAGVEYYWTGSGFSVTPTNVAGEHVYLVGIAKNATDLSLEIEHLYKNS
jgi:hypothetical protein